MPTGINQAFNGVFGRLRVSVCHACQLRCVFCHREGIANHWAPVFLDPTSFDVLLRAYRTVDGREVNLTGGEPTLHPAIGELLEVAGRDRTWRLTLHTNGLAIDRVLPQLRRGLVDEVRVSLHSTDDSFGKKFLGRAWSFGAIAKGIVAVRDAGTTVTAVFTYSVETAGFLRDVVRLVDALGINLLVLDLISTRWMRVHERARGAGKDDVIEALRPHGTIVGIEHDGGGCGLLTLRTRNGNRWQVKDVKFGRQFARVCQECALRKECGEGVYALRVDATGVFRPCLLRGDLERRLAVPFASKEAVIGMFELMCRLMTKGPRTKLSPVGSELVTLEPATPSP